jgi:hypothetical protein
MCPPSIVSRETIGGGIEFFHVKQFSISRDAPAERFVKN